MSVIKTDICVIGGGSGGLSVAAGAVQMGAKVVLFEGNKMGGDCLNYGCVPSKSLLAAAKAAHHHGTNAFGVSASASASGGKVNMAAVKAHIDSVIAEIAPHDSVERFTNLGVRVIEAPASFTGRRQVSGGGVDVKAKYIVVATGSSPFVPPIAGIDKTPYFTNETIFSNTKLPAHLIVIGGGPIGIEMAQAYRRLGAKVTLIEAMKILGRDAKVLVEDLHALLKNEGITILEGTEVISVAGKKGAVRVTTRGGHEGVIEGSDLLVAVGRKPNLDKLNLDVAGIRYTNKGILTDNRLRTSNRRVFAIGDVAGRQQFTHIAGYHAGIAIRNMLFRLPAKANAQAVPWVTYTDPELAHVGLTYDDAEAKGLKPKRLIIRLADNDRARAERRGEGAIVAVTTKKGKILGASILAPHAGEMIQPWVLAMSAGLKIGAMASFIAPYPTYGEISKRAAGLFYTPKLFSPTTRAVVRFLLRLSL
ncbi:MAG: FAD-dependent oxidoreductase [Proteobacteria bacterium]|nr:FAD-dependent oxidoreductase [Pseudomonadota bacterium]